MICSLLWEVRDLGFEHKDYIYCLDETSWDSTMCQKMLEAVRDFRLSILDVGDGKNAQRLKRLYDETIHTYIATTEGDLVRKHTGNPSGSPNTIADNTIGLFWTFSYAYVRCFQKIREVLSKVPCYEMVASYLYGGDFLKNVLARDIDGSWRDPSFLILRESVKVKMCGDDNIWNVRGNASELITAENIAFIWRSEMGVKAHAPHDKGELSYAPLHLSARGDCPPEMVYLSMQTLRLSSGTYVPVPERNRVFSSLLYGSSKVSPLWSLMRACALRQESFWDPVCRERLADFIKFMLTQKMQELKADRSVPFTLYEVLTFYKTDYQLIQQYLGQEAGYVQMKPTPDAMILAIKSSCNIEVSNARLKELEFFFEDAKRI
jgi:hypothetical protein